MMVLNRPHKIFEFGSSSVGTIASGIRDAGITLIKLVLLTVVVLVFVSEFASIWRGL